MILPDRASEKALNYAAPVIMGSPWWLPPLDTISTYATKIIPIATLAWIIFQFGLKAYDVWKHKGEVKDKEED